MGGKRPLGRSWSHYKLEGEKNLCQTWEKGKKKNKEDRPFMQQEKPGLSKRKKGETSKGSKPGRKEVWQCPLKEGNGDLPSK